MFVKLASKDNIAINDANEDIDSSDTSYMVADEDGKVDA